MSNVETTPTFSPPLMRVSNASSNFSSESEHRICKYVSQMEKRCLSEARCHPSMGSELNLIFPPIDRRVRTSVITKQVHFTLTLSSGLPSTHLPFFTLCLICYH